MNIKELLPENVNYDELKAKAPKYEGTKAELARMYKEGKIVLVTNNSGEVISIYVKAAEDNVMLDRLAEDNFKTAYSCKPVMSWIEDIVKGKDDENKSIYTDEELAELENEEEDSQHDTSDVSPDSVVVTAQEVEDYGSVERAFRHKVGYCIARGSTFNYCRYGTGSYVVTNYTLGRKLSSAEVLAMELDTRRN